jgi:ABC-type sugar transport system ATPase subunit
LELKATLKSKIEVVESLGDQKVIYFSDGGHRFIGKVDGHVPVPEQGEWELTFDANKIHIFDAATEKNLTARVEAYEPPKQG